MTLLLKYISSYIFMTTGVFGMLVFFSPIVNQIYIENEIYFSQRINIFPTFEKNINLGKQSSVQQLDSKPINNTLSIPSIGVEGVIHEGYDESTLNKGIWRKPRSSNPLIKGNMVLTAHRFMYTSGPNTFFNLDKVNLNEEINIYWLGAKYIYRVRDIKVVKDTEIWIERSNGKSQLTLYTCTPLWTSEKRLVVFADLIS